MSLAKYMSNAKNKSVELLASAGLPRQSKKIKKVELLAPAGNLEKLKYAVHYGADAVYAGVPDFSLRARINKFTEESLREAVNFVHQLSLIHISEPTRRT